MFIKSIKLKNFQCYYGDNHEVNFTKGLNIVTGSIASGKSKLFDAFYWVLNDKIYVTGKDWLSTKSIGVTLINDKAKFESKNIDDLIETSVELKVITDNGPKTQSIEYTITRQLLVTRKSMEDCFIDSTWSISNSTLSVESIDPKNFNLDKVDGIDAKEKIEKLFPSKISPYIWFQGEALDKLIDFDNKGTLRKAIDYISYVPLYRSMNNIMTLVDNKISKTKRTEIGKISGDAKLYNELSRLIEEKTDTIRNNRSFIEEKKKTLDAYKEKMEIIQKELSALAEFPKLNEEKIETENDISNINDDLERLDIHERKKFSSLWMLLGTKKLLEKAESKLFDFEEYRQLQISKEYDLPEDVPGDVYLDKMLEKELCLICNRPAKKDSEEYKYIESRKNRKVKPEYLTPENEKIYTEVSSYKSRVGRILKSISSVKDEIIEHRNNFEEKNNELIIYREKLVQIEDDIDTLYTKKGIDVSDGAATHRKKDGEYQVLNETINNLNRKIEGAKASVRDAEMDIASNENKLEKIQRANTKTKIIEEEISKYTEYLVKQISELEKSEYDKLIDQIESSANISFEDITSVNKTIDGNIKIDRNTFRVLNVDDSGRELKNYNTGHYTLMKMCIINAIISLTNDYKNTAYPFITDAPTSNLDEKATFAYLESISETFDQSIVITKDISEDEIESIKNQNYIKGLFQLKIKNDTGNDKMNRTEAYSTITSLI